MRLLILDANPIEQIDRRIVNMAKIFIQRGWDVQIIGTTGREEGFTCKIQDGIAALAMPPSHVDWNSFPFPWTEALEEHARRYPSQAIMACDLPALPAARTISRLFDIPLIYDAHELYYEQGSGHSSEDKTLMRYMERKCLSDIDLFMTVSDLIAFLFQSFHLMIDKPKVFYNAPDFIQTPTEAEIRDARRFLGIPDNGRYLLFHGSMTQGRNLGTLMKAFSKLNRKDLYLVYLGYGEVELFRSWSKKSGENVFVLDAVPQDSLPAFLSGATALIIPYPASCLNNMFCWPNKLSDALQLSVPVVANHALITVRSLIHEYGVGVAGDMSSVEKTVELIETAVDTLESESLKRNFAGARKIYGWETQVNNLKGWLHDLQLPGF